MKTALATVLFAGCLGGPALAQDSDAVFHATTLTLEAEGEVKAAPDQASITLGVDATAPSAAQAMRRDADQMSAVLAALRAQGLAERDIQTSSLSLNAQYVYAQNQPPTLTGYQASNAVTVTVRDLARLGAVIDAVSAAGANQINGVSFGLADPRGAQDQARRAAVKALAAKAALYAEATGYHIARLVSLSEEGGGAPTIQARPMLMRSAAPTPVEPGELDVRIAVSGVYELAK